MANSDVILDHFSEMEADQRQTMLHILYAVDRVMCKKETGPARNPKVATRRPYARNTEQVAVAPEVAPVCETYVDGLRVDAPSSPDEPAF